MVRSRANQRPHRKRGCSTLPSHFASWIYTGGVVPAEKAELNLIKPAPARLSLSFSHSTQRRGVPASLATAADARIALFRSCHYPSPHMLARIPTGSNHADRELGPA